MVKKPRNDKNMTDRTPARMLRLVTGCESHAAAIAAMTAAAFERQYGSGDGEAALIAGLRAGGDVVVELAALEGEEVVGHVLFSRLTVEPATLRIAALAPICARVDRQKSGIGTALIRAGLDACREKGFDAVAVLGDPEYYRRFGFTAALGRSLQCEYSGPHFQALELHAGALGGKWRVTYPRAFAGV
jgi:putative acetyltransferase